MRERFVCGRCGGTQGIKLPARALDYAAAVDRFMQAHAGCEEKAE